MRRPIVHIGLHKTATSWFQKHVYPHATSHRFVDRVRARAVLLGGSAFDFDPVRARAALGFDDPDPRPPLICDEDLSGFLHIGRTSGYVAKAVAERLHEVAPEAQIVIFVRSQPAMIASAYHQYLREGGTAGAKRYLLPDQYAHAGRMRPFTLPGFSFDQFQYHQLVDHYDRLFGTNNVHIFAYEELTRDRAAVIGRMRRDLGMLIDRPVAGDSVVNASYRAGLIPFVRLLNLFTARAVRPKRTIVHLPYWYSARKWLLERLNRLPLFGTRPPPERLLGRRMTRWIEQNHWPGNRRLAARMGIDLGALGYAVDPPAAPVAKPSRSPALTWIRN